MASILRMALEAIQPVQKEDEMVFYGRIKNFDDLKKASSMETHEQYEIKVEKTDKNVTKGRIRCRLTTPREGEAFYTVTAKTPNNKGLDANSSYETNTPGSEVIFTQFKCMAESGMVKDRYFFPIDDKHVWEVDMFKSANGSYHEWIKIDLEMNGILNIPNFPFEMDEIIMSQDGNRTPEENAKIETLYKTVFTVPNPFVGNVG